MSDEEPRAETVPWPEAGAGTETTPQLDPDEAPPPPAPTFDAPEHLVPPAPAVGHGVLRGRFALLYLGLGAVLAVAIAELVVLLLQPGPPKPPAWSSWQPASGNSTKVAAEVATHVSREYHVDAAGGPLVAVFPSAPEITQGTKVQTVSTIAIRTSPTSQNFSRIVSTSGALQEQLCGLGSQCATAAGGAGVGRLVRREALELALYTFKYAPTVDALIAFLPPAPGKTPSKLLYLERSALSTQLSEPLSKTLPLAAPPLPKASDAAEAATIDQLTLPVEYGFQYQALNDGTQALILTPGST